MGGETQWPSAEAKEKNGIPPPAGGTASGNPTSQMDAPQSSGPPPFLTKTFEMVDDPATDAIVSWSEVGSSFVVWNTPEFAQELLPKYFKHNNFSSFVRQLNTYGFRKVDPDRWEFANEGFLRGRRDLLRSIHRRKPSSHAQQQQGAYVEGGKSGLEAEIERLKTDKNVLMLELARVRQQQQSTFRDLQLMAQRLHVSESRQQRMITFLAKAMANPSLFAQFVSQQNESNHLVRKKRRLPIQEDGDMDESMSPESSIENQIVTYQPSELGEARARARVIEIFCSSDSHSAMDSRHFEALMREPDTSPNSGDSNILNRQSRVTVEEINTKLPDIFSSAPVVIDVSVNEAQEATSISPLNFDIMRASSGDKSAERSRHPHSEYRDSNDLHEPDCNRGTASHEAEVQSARTDSAAHNSGFWEQFLTEDPQPVTRAEIDLEREPESETEDVSQGGKNAQQSSFGRPRVEFLSHQLGQLAPG
ncbi:heat stress transcription factor A-2e [Physcomitrium patens]|uniref:HSF-type DNA-binding domain-containing protein n=1 Tax=Physcomitrium patens TaxID=3218 RepID=A0A2K1JVG9_PHYPA|nr:heat stress transcription factor A-2e-like [Physcomitrium patens]PNR45518.1 hypothetical protein PHYPA_015289 [Physcomitrium patens]|eukprot:XP_024389317.1 heat stress transcription factor A-2e-like [Physcomitrella patens]